MRFGRVLGVTCATACSAITLVTATFLGACKDRFYENDEGHRPQVQKGPAEVSEERGQFVLALDLPTQKRLGLEVVTLEPSATRDQVTAPAVVLSAEDLASLRNSYLSAQAQLQKSRIEASVAHNEYARLRTLFEENQNISQKALQSAEGSLQANEADVRISEQQLNLQESVARQAWGSVVGRWVVEGSPELQQIFDQHAVLVQVTISSTATFEAPRTGSLEIPGGARTRASFVSALPRVDPRIQGKAFLYLVPAHSGLSPGVNLVAHLSIGNQMQGVVVPTAAVVWSEGTAWAYEQTSADRFARRAVATDAPVEKGFFVRTGLSAGDKVVNRGAQTLLTQELLAHRQGSGEPDEE